MSTAKGNGVALSAVHEEMQTASAARSEVVNRLRDRARQVRESEPTPVEGLNARVIAAARHVVEKHAEHCAECRELARLMRMPG